MGKNIVINLVYIVANIVMVLFLAGLIPMAKTNALLEPSLDEPSPVPEIVLPVLSVPAKPAPALVAGVPGMTKVPARRSSSSAQVIRRLPVGEKVVALTFDDGPGKRTSQLLAILKEKDVPATFFLVGRQVQYHPHLVRQIAAAGHDIGNHSWSHPRLTDLTRERIEREAVLCSTAILTAGADVGPYFRPPYGSRNQVTDDTLLRLGYHIVLWDVDTRDWQYNDTGKVLGRALDGLRPGSIVLFHDGPEVTLRVLPLFIDEARNRGYRFVLLSKYLP